jgi:hypothetical protein
MRGLFISLFVLVSPIGLVAQIDPLLLKVAPKDSSKNLMNMDAVYNRPFIAMGKLPVSLGGYMEANWQHLNDRWGFRGPPVSIQENDPVRLFNNSQTAKVFKRNRV